MALSNELKKEIKSEITEKLKKKITVHDFKKVSGNPFVDIIFGKLSNIKTFVHGIATLLGTQYEQIAIKIANSNPRFLEAKKMVLEGEISQYEKSMITDIVKDLEEGGLGSEYDEEIGEVYSVENKKLKKTRITIDLYLKDNKNKEYFIEMKGPDPNKKEVRAAKEDILNIVAIKKRQVELKDFHKKVSVLLGIYYNNKPKKYSNWKVSPIFQAKKGMLVGKEFWDFLGGEGTFEDLKKIFEEIKKEIAPLIKKKLKQI